MTRSAEGGAPARPAAFRSRFLGTCTRCGACCAPLVSERLARCEYLEVTGRIGQPDASRCRVYAGRYDGMPIFVVDAETGTLLAMSVCRKDSIEEDASIAGYGQGRGCTLTEAA